MRNNLFNALDARVCKHGRGAAQARLPRLTPQGWEGDPASRPNRGPMRNKNSPSGSPKPQFSTSATAASAAAPLPLVSFLPILEGLGLLAGHALLPAATFVAPPEGAPPGFAVSGRVTGAGYAVDPRCDGPPDRN